MYRTTFSTIKEGEIYIVLFINYSTINIFIFVSLNFIMANSIHPHMLNVKQYQNYVGNKPFWCNTPDKQVNLQLKFKTRKISAQQSDVCSI